MLGATELQAARSKVPEPTLGGEGFSSLELDFPGGSRSTHRARVYLPQHAAPGHDWPVAILLHGYAQALEAQRALAAWNVEYEVLRAYSNLRQRVVPRSRYMSDERAREITQALGAAPFSGMVLVTPITPIPYFQRDPAYTFAKYAEWIRERLLPRVAKLGPISTKPEHVGLAGHSMGGLVGLELMSRFPEQFAAYCGIQIAIKQRDAYRYAWLLDRAFKKLDGVGRPIRVVMATRDTYRWSNVAFWKALKRKQLDASLQLRAGAHSSEWMRGAGSIESLLWLDQMLNGGGHHSPPSDDDGV
jgi:pimeloyl-ACP methyl ester carboxylesterase